MRHSINKTFRIFYYIDIFLRKFFRWLKIDSDMEKRGTGSPPCCCNADDNTIDMGLFNRPGEYVHTEITVSNRDKKKEEKMPKICPLQHITLLPFFDKFGLYVKMA